MPFRSSLARSAGKLLGVFKERDLSLRGATQSDRVTVLGLNATGGTQSGPDGVGSALEPGNGYKYHMFTTPGSFVVTNGIFPTTIDYLLVAGGGSGGNTPDSGNYQMAGGGGAGAFRTGQITTLQPASSYPVVIGTGGLYSGGPQGAGPYPQTEGWYGGNGLDSSFNAPGGNGVSAITAAGGGSGGGGTNDAAGEMGQVGGSAGGGGGYATPGPGGVIVASGDQYPGTGSSFPSPANGWGSDSNTGTDGGGGGGAGEEGGEHPVTGAAGLPAFNADTGIPPSYGTPGPSAGRWFGGGGGVGADGTGIGPFAGGAGGGGAGGVMVARPGTPGTANTGSGGGGAGADNWPNPGLGTGGNGADGIVIIRYAKYA